MSATTSHSTPSMDRLQRIRADVHPGCVVCSPGNAAGLQLSFSLHEGGELAGEFECPRQFEGYPGRLQGGVIASLMDGVMTNCLFAHGVVAVTTEMTVQYRHPVETGKKAELLARIERETHGLYFMTAELRQDEKLAAVAKGKFFAQQHLDPGNRTGD